MSLSDHIFFPICLITCANVRYLFCWDHELRNIKCLARPSVVTLFNASVGSAGCGGSCLLFTIPIIYGVVLSANLTSRVMLSLRGGGRRILIITDNASLGSGRPGFHYQLVSFVIWPASEMAGPVSSVVVLDRGNNTTCTINLHGKK